MSKTPLALAKARAERDTLIQLELELQAQLDEIDARLKTIKKNLQDWDKEVKELEKT